MPLKGFLPAWDFARRRVDVGPFVAWGLATLADHGVRAPSLSRLHEVVDIDGARVCSQALTVASRAPRPRALMNAMVRTALPEVPPSAIAVQACGHVRVLVPGDTRTPAATHTDAAVGHQLDERTLWFALTDAIDTAALHGTDFASSWAPERARRSGDQLLFANDVVPLRPLNVDAGEVLLFTPLHIHGAKTNREAHTRVSVDIRVAPLAPARARNPFVWFPLDEAGPEDRGARR